MTISTGNNGIDVDRLVATVRAVEQDPNLGAFTFRARSTWLGGTSNLGEIRGFAQAGQADGSRAVPFALKGDEPPALLGSNEGPNAVELILQALAFCFAVGFAANAAARGIELDRLDMEVVGDLDVGRFLGLSGPRPGFTRISAKAIVSSPNATADQLAELSDYVQETSPVRDCLANPVPVETRLEVT